MPEESPSGREFVYFKCIEVRQPIGVFYVGAMSSSQVIAISYADVRRIEARDVERYIGIQRPLEDDRVKELRKYVRTVDSSFPTSVILAVSGENAEYDEGEGIMRIKRNWEIAKIIDGQHRIAGLLSYEGAPFQLNVTIFVDMDIEDQAHLFATINLKQTKVNKSLAYDLFDFASLRSPQKTCHNLAKFMNFQKGGPLERRIKILGRATGQPLEFLTQALFVERLIGYISMDPMLDRDLIRRRLSPARAANFQEREKKLFFRNMFIDGRDDEITLVLVNFFTAVLQKWPSAWVRSDPGHVLNRSTGFGALMRLLADIYVSMDKIGSVPGVDEFLAYFGRVQLGNDDFRKERFVPGTSGESLLYRTLSFEMGFRREIG